MEAFASPPQVNAEKAMMGTASEAMILPVASIPSISGHLDVHQDHAGAKRPRHLHGFPAGSRLADDPDPRVPPRPSPG